MEKLILIAGLFSVLAFIGIFSILFKCFLFLVYHFLDNGKLGFFDYLKRS